MTRFSETLMDYFQSPRNQGLMNSPDCVGTAGIPGQGRYIQLFLRVTSDRVTKMQFSSYGCGVTIAVCSVLTELTEGRTRSECEAIDVEAIVRALDGVPAHKMDTVEIRTSGLGRFGQQGFEASLTNLDDALGLKCGDTQHLTTFCYRAIAVLNIDGPQLVWPI
jgi:NifU-like protein involved in Fe-S cluster formation